MLNFFAAARPLHWAGRTAPLLATFCILSLFFWHFFAVGYFGVDIPLDDDWRDLMSRSLGSFSPAYLLAPANDTVFATGRLLDSLNASLFGANSVIYQGISFLVTIGLLIYLQISAICRHAKSNAVAAIAVLQLAFMLQAGTYWGQQSLAYHQALPLLAIFAILFLIDKRVLENRLAFNSVAIACVGVAGGFAYISGAVAVAIMAGWTFFCISGNQQTERQYWRSCAIGLLIAALVTVPVQAWVIIVKQHGNIHASVPWALPHTVEFWAFALGLVARSLGFWGEQSVKLAVGVAVLVAAMLAGLLGYSIKRIRGCATADAPREFDFFYSCGAIILVVFAYVGMIAMARANLRAPSVDDFRGIFLLAQERFHFFWITLALPWLILGLSWAVSSKLGSRPLYLALAIVLVAFVCQLSTEFRGFDLARYYNSTAMRKQSIARCVEEKSAANKPIVCDQIFDGDVSSAIRYAKLSEFSFARTLNDPRVPGVLRPTPPLSSSSPVVVTLPVWPNGDRPAKIQRLGLLIGTYGRVNLGSAELEIIDGEKRISKSFRLEDLPDNQYRFFDLGRASSAKIQVKSDAAPSISLWNSIGLNGVPVTCAIVEYVGGSIDITEGCPVVRLRRTTSIQMLVAAFLALVTLGVLLWSRRERSAMRP